MKRITAVNLLLFLVLLLGSCHSGPPHTTIATNDGTTSARIECEGDIHFTEDSSSVKSISPYGYIEYRGNDKHVLIESDEQGKLSYELYRGETKIPLDSAGKLFLAATLKEMFLLGLRSPTIQQSN